MKKYLFFLIAIFLYFGLSAQNQHKNSHVSSNACLPDSAASFILKIDTHYDSIYYDKMIRYFYTYDSNGNAVNTLVLDKADDTTWVISHHIIKTYDVNNNLTDSLYQWWAGSNSQWVNGFRQAISYNSSNKPAIILSQNWYVSAAAWNNYTRTLNYYDVSNNQTASKLQYWDNNNSTWITDDSVQYVYNPAQRIVAHRYYQTDYGMLPPALFYAGKDTLIYNLNNDPVSYFKRVLIAPAVPANSDSISWVYDASHRLIYKNMLHKNGPSQWLNNFTDFYSYDSNNRMIRDSSYSGGTIRYYNACVAQGFYEPDKEASVISIYPNPVNSLLSISTKTDYYGVKIINLIGETIKTVENNSAPIPVSDLSNGVYFIRVLDKNNRILKTGKFIKE